jgi:hypothetical protein
METEAHSEGHRAASGDENPVMSLPDIGVFGGDFARLQEVIKDLNERFAQPPKELMVTLCPDFEEIDVYLAKLTADDIIDKCLAKYKDAFTNPSFFENLTRFCQEKYRAVIEKWMAENGNRNTQGGSRSIRDGEAS